MIWVLLAVAMAFVVFFSQYAWRHRKDACGSVVGAFFGWMAVVGIVVAACSLFTTWLGFEVLDDRIAIIQEENDKIEIQVAEAVKQYQDYESGIFTDVSQNIDSDVLVLIE